MFISVSVTKYALLIHRDAQKKYNSHSNPKKRDNSRPFLVEYIPKTRLVIRSQRGPLNNTSLTYHYMVDIISYGVWI